MHKRENGNNTTIINILYRYVDVDMYLKCIRNAFRTKIPSVDCVIWLACLASMVNQSQEDHDDMNVAQRFANANGIQRMRAINVFGSVKRQKNEGDRQIF